MADNEVPAGYELLSPIPMDQATIRQLVAAGADLRQPRHVIHYLYFPAAHLAEGAGLAAQAEGWQVASSEVSAEEWAVRCERRDYVLLAGVVHGDERFFEGLARRFRGDHDGWEAAVR